jgi:hypothetical protein
MSLLPLFRSTLLAGLALGLANAARAADPIPTATGNAAHDMLARFSPAERNRTLDRLLHSVDRADCDVTDSTFLEYRSGQFAAWRATCSDGRRFVLDLIDGSERTVAVLDCSETVEMKARCGL